MVAQDLFVIKLTEDAKRDLEKKTFAFNICLQMKYTILSPLLYRVGLMRTNHFWCFEVSFEESFSTCGSCWMSLVKLFVLYFLQFIIGLVLKFNSINQKIQFYT